MGFPRTWTRGRVQIRRSLPDLLIQIEMSGLPAPQMEYYFHPKRKWRIDYCWPEYKLAVEKEGGAWIRGRHTRGRGFVSDIEKYNAIQMAGFVLLRFTPQDIEQGKAIDAIREWFKSNETKAPL